MHPLRGSLVACAAVAMLGCADRIDPTAPTGGGDADPSGLARATEQSPRFFFLPPVGDRWPRPLVEFDPALEPVVRICEWSGESCVRVVAEHDMNGRGLARVQLDHGDDDDDDDDDDDAGRRLRSRYKTWWKTPKLTANDIDRFRISVVVVEPTREAPIEVGFGFVDVVGRNRKPRRADDTHPLRVRGGETLSIGFWIGEGIVATVTVAPPRAGIRVRELQQFTAEVRDLHGALLTDRAVEWSSSDGRVARALGDGVFRGTAVGAATVTARSEGRVGQASLDVAPAAPVPVFPGAEGFGVTTPAGRGGAIVRVTNLDDAGPGSLREAMAAPGPRIIVFEVAGTIWLQSNIQLSSPFVTVAGQTAPSPGVTLAGGGIEIGTHDVLLQHIRIRVGDLPAGPMPEDRDAISIEGGSYNVVVDHVSGAWALDEVMSISASSSDPDKPHDVTVRNCIIAEGLAAGLHGGGNRSKGSLVRRSSNVTLIGNLWANNERRNPILFGGTSTLVVNNLLYNTGSGIRFDDPEDDGVLRATAIGNRIQPGPSSYGLEPVEVENTIKDGTLIHLADNWAPGVTDDPWSIATVESGLGFDPRAAQPPVALEGLTVRPAAIVEQWVLAAAGARPADRDAVDARIVGEVRARAGRFLVTQSTVGGWPSLPSVSRALQVPERPHEDDDWDGYTNVEEWLHAMASAVEGGGSP